MWLQENQEMLQEKKKYFKQKFKGKNLESWQTEKWSFLCFGIMSLYELFAKLKCGKLLGFSRHVFILFVSWYWFNWVKASLQVLIFPTDPYLGTDYMY